jgi:hypothetical protein
VSKAADSQGPGVGNAYPSLKALESA